MQQYPPPPPPPLPKSPPPPLPKSPPSLPPLPPLPPPSYMSIALESLFFGAISRTITAPFERVRLILQNQDASKLVGSQVKRYEGIPDIITRVWREQGIRSYWRGNLQSIISVLATLPLNYKIKQTLLGKKQRNINEERVPTIF